MDRPSTARTASSSPAPGRPPTSAPARTPPRVVRRRAAAPARAGRRGLGHPDRARRGGRRARAGANCCTAARCRAARCRAATRAVRRPAAPDRRRAGARARPDLPPRSTGGPDCPERGHRAAAATEWLDNVPLDVAADRRRPAGARYLVDPATGAESLGDPGSTAERTPRLAGTRLVAGRRRRAGRRDRAGPGTRRGPRPSGTVRRGAGARRRLRAPAGRAAGGRDAHRVPGGPAGAAGARRDRATSPRTWPWTRSPPPARGRPVRVLAGLAAGGAAGARGRRRPTAAGLAGTDPAGYVRALAAASAAAELTDPAGLGGHWWLLQPVGVATLDGLDSWHDDAA